MKDSNANLLNGNAIRQFYIFENLLITIFLANCTLDPLFCRKVFPEMVDGKKKQNDENIIEEYKNL